MILPEVRPAAAASGLASIVAFPMPMRALLDPGKLPDVAAVGLRDRDPTDNRQSVGGEQA